MGLAVGHFEIPVVGTANSIEVQRRNGGHLGTFCSPQAVEVPSNTPFVT